MSVADGVGGIAALTALFGLAVMWRQLAVAREAAAGRGLQTGAEPAWFVSVVNGVEQPRAVECMVEACGPGTWCDVARVVMLANGTEKTVIQRVARLDNRSERITGTLDLTTDEMRGAWFVVTWLAPHRDGLRTEALRIRVLNPAPMEDQTSGGAPSMRRARIPEKTVEQFRWNRTWRDRYWVWERLWRRVPSRLRYRIPAVARTAAYRSLRRAGTWKPVPRRHLGRGWLPEMPGPQRAGIRNQ